MNRSEMRSLVWLSFIIIFSVIGSIYSVAAQEYGLGDIPLDETEYRESLRILPDQALPSSYDARDDGIVTSAKHQGNCGSCWSFAIVGAFESHLLKQFGVGPLDLSEQEQVSCNLSMSGCCGGSVSAIRWWETRGPIYESCFPYGESSTLCDDSQRTVPCEDASGCAEIPYRVENYHTINADSQVQVKTSLYDDGPSYFRFSVYDDFFTFWNTGGSGEIYTNDVNSTYEGGHAVLIIGWDDGTGAYLLKNSWGAAGGPNGDGTFWMAYSGHAHDLNFGMANFDLTEVGPDLLVTSVNAGPGPVQPGGYIAVSFTVWNQGSADSGSFYNRISLATTPYGIDIPLGNFPMSSINAGLSSSDGQVVQIPIDTPPGDYYVTVFTDCFQVISESDENNNIGSTDPGIISVQPDSYIFYDDMENPGSGNWIFDPPWGYTTSMSHGGSYCITDSPDSGYSDNVNISATLSTGIDMSSSVMPVLSFWHSYSLEANADFGYVDISTNGGVSWSTIFFVTGHHIEWQQEKIDLTPYSLQPDVRIRFRLQTNSSNIRDGWYIDDVSIGETIATVSYPFYDDMESGTDNWLASSWDLVTPGHDSTYCLTDSPEGNTPANVNTSLALASTIDLRSAVNPQLSFWHRYVGQPYMIGYVEVSVDRGLTYKVLKSYYNDVQWSQEQIDLADYVGLPDIRLRFRLLSGSGNRDGWYMDNVRIGEELSTLVDWCNLDSPASTSIWVNETTENIYGLVYKAGVTDSPGQGPNIIAQLVYGPDGSDPESGGWTWVDAVYDSDVEDKDRYVATLTVGVAGNYDYCYRYRIEGSSVWTYGDLDGSSNGYSSEQAGYLEVADPGEGWFVTLNVASAPQQAAPIEDLNPVYTVIGARLDATDDFDEGIDVPRPPRPLPPILDAYSEGSGLFDRLQCDLRAEVLPHDDFDKTWIFHAYAENDEGEGFTLCWDMSYFAQDLEATITQIDPPGTFLNMSSKSCFDEPFQEGVEYTFAIRVARFEYIDIPITAGWNMISCPGTPGTPLVSELVSGIPVLPYFYTWDGGGYIMVDEVKFDKGYWAAATADCVLRMPYMPLHTMECPLSKGWNMTGSIDCVCPVGDITSDPPDSILTNSIYTWDPSTGGYVIVTEILQGGGYWTAAMADCMMIMSCRASPEIARNEGTGNAANLAEATWKGVLTVESHEQSQELVFGMDPLASDGFDRMLDKPLPPPPATSSVDMKKHGNDKLSSILKAAWLIQDDVFPMLGESYVREGTSGVWQLSLELPKPGKIEWSGLPEGYRCMIHYGKRYIDMNAKKFLPLPAGEHNLTLVVNAADSLPRKTQLLANYPNPFNPETWIPYELKEDNDVTIKIYTATGQLVRTLNLGHKPAGFYTAKDKAAYWDGRNESGEQVSTGVYFYTIQAGSFAATKKMILAK